MHLQRVWRVLGITILCAMAAPAAAIDLEIGVQIDSSIVGCDGECGGDDGVPGREDDEESPPKEDPAPQPDPTNTPTEPVTEEPGDDDPAPTTPQPSSGGGDRSRGSNPNNDTIFQQVQRAAEEQSGQPQDNGEVIDLIPAAPVDLVGTPPPPPAPSTPPPAAAPPQQSPPPAEPTPPASQTEPVFVDLPAPKSRPPFVFFGRPVPIDARQAPDELIVLAGAGLSDADAAALFAQLGLSVVTQTEFGLVGARAYRLSLPSGTDVADLLQTLAESEGILGAQPNFIYAITQASAGDAGAEEAPEPDLQEVVEPEPETASRPVDLRRLQYAPEKLKLTDAHRLTRGEGVIIGLIDTGVDAQHREFSAADLQTHDVLGNEGPPEDHGTAMAGLMLASGGLDGIAPGARLLGVRAFETSPDGETLSTSFALASAVDWLAAQEADVLNLSFAGPRDPLLLQMLDMLEQRGVPVIAAAGNFGPGAEPAYPGAHRHSIAVTATDDTDAVFDGANRGYYLAVAAPGVDVLSPLAGDRYDLLSGTSVATAEMTGIVALMLSGNPNLGPADIRARLMEAAVDLGPPGVDPDYGAGLVDAGRAVSE